MMDWRHLSYYSPERENWETDRRQYRLLSTIFELKKELKIAKVDLESITKSVHMMNSGIDDLNKILSSGKQASDKIGVGFSHSKVMWSKENLPCHNFLSLPKILRYHSRLCSERTVLWVSQIQNSKEVICHFCGKAGHIRPYFFCLHRRRVYQRQQKLLFKHHDVTWLVRNMWNIK